MAEADFRDTPTPYYNILILGKTGQATANKLLGVDPVSNTWLPHGGDIEWGYYGVIEVCQKEWKVDVRYFVVGDEVHSVTTECELLSNVKADMYKFHVPYKSLNSVAALSWATSSILWSNFQSFHFTG